jgi:hypothetical protein
VDTSTCGSTLDPCGSIKGAIDRSDQLNYWIFVLENGVYTGENNTNMLIENRNYEFLAQSENVTIGCLKDSISRIVHSYVDFVNITFRCDYTQFLSNVSNVLYSESQNNAFRSILTIVSLFLIKSLVLVFNVL